MNATVIAAGLIHDDLGTGVISLLHPGTDGAVRLVGDGSQHWTTVHVRDLADLYARALEDAGRRRLLLGVTQCPQVVELAAAAGPGAPVIAEPAEATRQRFGTDRADALLMDQVADASATRHALGWKPTERTAADGLRARFSAIDP